MNKNSESSNKKGNRRSMLIMLTVYAVFITLSILTDFDPGLRIADNFVLFARDMFMLFPPAYVLVGLFVVWVDRKTVETYFGESSGFMGYVTAILLACTTLYPFIVVLPMAAALAKKGARLSIVLTYLSASAICRIPMTIFEASYLGIRFSIIRYLVSLPLIVVTSILLEKMVGKNYFDKISFNKTTETT